jgi:hypothetical protein
MECQKIALTMENLLIMNVGELTEPVLELRLARPEKKPTERGRVVPTFSMVDPKGSKP